MADFVAEFGVGQEFKIRKRRLRISNLEKRGKKQRERLSKYESLVLIYGDCLEDIVLARLMKNTVTWQKKVRATKVGQAIVEVTKQKLVLHLISLTAKETWHLQIKTGLTDQQFDKLRMVLGEKREGWNRLFVCSKSAGKVRRKEQSQLFVRLGRQRSHSGGCYFSMKECMRYLISYMGMRVFLGRKRKFIGGN
jgi:hypothetical protein